MTYKIKSLLYLVCFVAASCMYYQMDMNPTQKDLSEKTNLEEENKEGSEETEKYAELTFNYEK